jgi:hypothetical protein
MQFFKVTLNGNSQPSLFIFVSEDSSISGWNPQPDSTHAIIAVDNGTNNGSKRAVYKGSTLGVASGHKGNELWLGNFGDGRINNYDPTTDAFLGTINRADGTPLQFDNLWDLSPLVKESISPSASTTKSTGSSASSRKIKPRQRTSR